MSGKRRRSWEKMAPHSKSNDGGWEGILKNDDISRGRDRNIRSFHNDWETHYTTTTRNPYRSRSRSRGREWETFSGDRNKSCSNEYSRRRDDVRKEFAGARSQRGGREDQSNSKSRQISNIQCRFFAAGRCYRDDCRFSHDNPRSHDTWQPHADVNASWDDDEEIQRSHNKPSWDWDDLDNRKRSWNGRPWDDDHDHDDNKTKSRNGNGTYSMDDKHRNDNNNNTHLNENANVLDTSGKGQVEIEKSPKKKQEEEEVVGNLQYEKSRSRRDKFTANNEYGRDDDDDDVRNNSRNLKERPRYTHDRNPRNHYDDHDGDDGRRCRSSKIPCKFFSEGKCYRDDCKFSHDSENNNNNNKSWSGPSWDDVASGRNRNSHDKKKSWDDDTKKPLTHSPPLNNAIHDLNALPSNQDTKQEGKFGNDENPEKKHRGAENGKKQEEEKVKEGNTASDEDKCMRHFRAALVECVKEILKPIWKEGKMTREVYKTVVKKVVDKITTTIQQNQIPPTQPKIQIYLTHSQPKIMKLVEAYVEKLVKA